MDLVVGGSVERPIKQQEEEARRPVEDGAPPESPARPQYRGMPPIRYGIGLDSLDGMAQVEGVGSNRP